MGGRKTKKKDPNAPSPPDEDENYISERLARLKTHGHIAPSPALPLPAYGSYTLFESPRSSNGHIEVNDIGLDPEDAKSRYAAEDAYVSDLLSFTTQNDLLQLLTGGVHILDFLTRSPDFYAWLIPESWRNWFDMLQLHEILDFVLRDDLRPLLQTGSGSEHGATKGWKNHPRPPDDLTEFIWSIRRLSLDRAFRDPDEGKRLPIHVAVGMKVKKVEEVAPFSRYIRRLANDIEQAKSKAITHLVDFGAGQNYLGRTLASAPTNRHVVAVESRKENVEGARRMDVTAKLSAKDGILRNKKAWKMRAEGTDNGQTEQADVFVPEKLETRMVLDRESGKLVPAVITPSPEGKGTVQHIEKRLDNGDLSSVVERIVDADAIDNGELLHSDDRNETDVLAVKSLKKREPNLMVISLHSCGNLSHHGLRSLTNNPAVSAAVIVGCCYNLVTERLTTPSYKLPGLRPEVNEEVRRDRLIETAGDPQGFPMSQKLSEYPVRAGKKGVHLNITTRMMAVQAPSNWSPEDCENFFTRHFYRCLLQRVFLDYGLTEVPDADEEYLGYVAGDSSVGYSAASGGGPPGSAIVVGSLRKSAYLSFVTYTRAALAKLVKDPKRGTTFRDKLGDIADATLENYERRYLPKKKELSIVWTLMAYSAQLAEALIVVDRWQWLREQDDVGECWVEPVFDYKYASPRNLAVIGVKR